MLLGVQEIRAKSTSTPRSPAPRRTLGDRSQYIHPRLVPHRLRRTAFTLDARDSVHDSLPPLAVPPASQVPWTEGSQGIEAVPWLPYGVPG